MIVFPVQIYYNYGYKEPFFVTFIFAGGSAMIEIICGEKEKERPRNF